MSERPGVDSNSGVEWRIPVEDGDVQSAEVERPSHDVMSSAELLEAIKHGEEVESGAQVYTEGLDSLEELKADNIPEQAIVRNEDEISKRQEDFRIVTARELSIEPLPSQMRHFMRGPRALVFLALFQLSGFVPGALARGEAGGDRQLIELPAELESKEKRKSREDFSVGELMALFRAIPRGVSEKIFVQQQQELQRTIGDLNTDLATNKNERHLAMREYLAHAMGRYVIGEGPAEIGYEHLIGWHDPSRAERVASPDKKWRGSTPEIQDDTWIREYADGLIDQHGGVAPIGEPMNEKAEEIGSRVDEFYDMAKAFHKEYYEKNPVLAHLRHINEGELYNSTKGVEDELRYETFELDRERLESTLFALSYFDLKTLRRSRDKLSKDNEAYFSARQSSEQLVTADGLERAQQARVLEYITQRRMFIPAKRAHKHTFIEQVRREKLANNVEKHDARSLLSKEELKALDTTNERQLPDKVFAKNVIILRDFAKQYRESGFSGDAKQSLLQISALQRAGWEKLNRGSAGNASWVDGLGRLRVAFGHQKLREPFKQALGKDFDFLLEVFERGYGQSQKDFVARVSPEAILSGKLTREQERALSTRKAWEEFDSWVALQDAR
jgi:hypothetical protein